MATVQIRGKGIVTIPARVRKKYGLNKGDTFTMIDLGEGCLLLKPRVSWVEQSGNRVTRILAGDKISEEEMLQALEEERERFSRERYKKE